jgi:hypothetical protein
VESPPLLTGKADVEMQGSPSILQSFDFSVFMAFLHHDRFFDFLRFSSTKK